MMSRGLKLGVSTMTMDRKSFLRAAAAGAGAAMAAIQAACGKRPAAKTAEPAPPGRTEKLVERVVADTTGAFTTAAVFMGDALGLFKAMAGAGAMSSAQLATRAGLNERYVLEWLRSVAASGYVDYQAASGKFELPAEHVPVLVDEDSPAFVMGLLQGAVPDIWMIPKLLTAFHTGKGIPYSEYPPETFASIERGTRPDYMNLLVPQWLPAVPGLVEKLKAGCSAADLGSGGGIASIQLAKAFPKVRAYGFEPYAPSVKRAAENARGAGLADRVSFATFDGVHVPGGPYGLITMNYALHHAGDHAGVLTSACRALDKDGVMLVVEYRRSERLEQDILTLRQVLYATSLTECMPTALAEGGPGYGTGIQASEMQRLAKLAGFRECAGMLPEDPLRSFFILRK